MDMAALVVPCPPCLVEQEEEEGVWDQEGLEGLGRQQGLAEQEEEEEGVWDQEGLEGMGLQGLEIWDQEGLEQQQAGLAASSLEEPVVSEDHHHPQNSPQINPTVGMM